LPGAGEAADSPPTVNGVVIKNLVAQNSYEGHLSTDEGAWSDEVAKRTGKLHSVCAKHKAAGIMPSSAGLPESYQKDMSSLIYDAYQSPEALESAINESRRSYGHSNRALRFINGVDNKREKVCGTYTQYKFSLGHCTTSIGEGFNANLKGQGSLKQHLARTSLVDSLDRCEKIARTQDRTCIEKLAALRRDGKRWSQFYQDHYDEFALLAAKEVVSCEKVGDDDVWVVTDKGGNEVKVNKATTVIHLGHAYIIPTCECGHYCTFFIWCPHIIRVYTESEDQLEDVANIHPFFILQNHVMWPDALAECNLPDYDDFPHLTSLALTTESTPAGAFSVPSAAAAQRNVFPAEYYNDFPQMPTSDQEKVSTLRELFDKCVAQAVSFGDSDTYRALHCRLSQAHAEMKKANERRMVSIDNPLPPNNGRSRKPSKDAMVNRSSLSRPRSNKRRKTNNSGTANNDHYGGFVNAQLKELCKAAKLHYSGKRAEFIERLETRNYVKNIIHLPDEDLRMKCGHLSIGQEGSRYDLLLRLIQKEFGGTQPQQPPLQLQPPPQMTPELVGQLSSLLQHLGNNAGDVKHANI